MIFFLSRYFLTELENSLEQSKTDFQTLNKENQSREMDLKSQLTKVEPYMEINSMTSLTAGFHKIKIYMIYWGKSNLFATISWPILRNIVSFCFLFNQHGQNIFYSICSAINAISLQGVHKSPTINNYED